MTENFAVHLVATQNCVDALGKERVSGEEWLVTVAHTECLPPQIGMVSISLGTFRAIDNLILVFGCL